MKRKILNLLPALLVALLILAVTGFIHRLSVAVQNDQIDSANQTYAQGLAARLEAHIQVRLGVVEHIREDWERGQIRSLDDFRADAAAVHALFDDLQALNWINPDGVIEVITPVAGNEPALGQDIRSLPAPARTLAEAEQSGETRLTRPITLAQGGTGFVAYLTIRVDGQIAGTLNTVFRAEPLIQSAMGQGGADGYRVWIEDAGSRLFGPSDSTGAEPHGYETSLSIGGRSWVIRSAPSADALARAATIVDEAILGGGALLALITAVLLNLALSQQRSLRESEERFAYAMKGASDGLWDWNPLTGKTYYSPRWFEMLGYRPDELPSKHQTFESLLHPDDRDRIINYPKTVIADAGDTMESEFRMRHKNGSWVNILSRGVIIQDQGRVVRFVGTHVDITERLANERALRRAQEILREGVEALPVGFAYYDSDNRLLVFNQAYARLLFSKGAHLEPGMRFDDLTIGSTAFAATRKRHEAEGSDDGAVQNWVYERGDAHWIRVLERRTGSGGFIQVLEDVTEARRHQDRLEQTHKLEAVGQLTGGIAHDFNNLLAVIMGNAELLEELDGDAAEITAAIVRATERGAELTQRLLAFSRRQTLSPEMVDLSGLIDGMRDMLIRTLGETFEIRTVTPDDLWGALADPGQVENAVLNLALNARDAMPDGGVLTIECANATMAGSAEPEALAIEPGDYVVLSVRDQGHGMTEDVRQQAFEPFFTTKGVGEGSGLGLSMVYGFAQQSGGQAEIRSEPGRGSTVTLYLPRADRPVESAVPRRLPATPQGRGETVLLIEDDAQVRRSVEAMLKRLGYNVVSAEDAAAARLRLAEGHDIRVVLSDVILPGGISGPRFASELGQSHPGLRVIFMSGYPADAIEAEGISDIGRMLLDKPFSKSELARKLTETLAAEALAS